MASSPRTSSFYEMASSPRTVGDIFKDYSARKDGILCALTNDVRDFYGLCDPGKKGLSLYGYVDKTWKVTVPTEELLHDIPEPAVGINHFKLLMPLNEWLSLVAVHSDSWLLSVAFYLGARLKPDEREQLFKLINAGPTVFEVVTKKNPLKDKATVESSSKPQGGTKRTSDGQVKSNPKVSGEGYKVEEDDQSEKPCGCCGEGAPWIECDMCMERFHEKCLQIIPAVFSGSRKEYICPSCNVRGVVPEKKLLKDKTIVEGTSKPLGGSKRTSDRQGESNPKVSGEGHKEDHSESICATCGRNDEPGVFWIRCDICENWYHGECVEVTDEMAESIDIYECPSCRS